MADTITKKKLCRQPAPIPKTFDPGISQHRLSYILASNLKWVNGTEIKYMFIEGPEAQKNVVRTAFKTWKNLGIGISFTEVTNLDDAMVRIGFDLSDGSWSYVGRDVLTIPKNKRTMNFGWDLTKDSYGMTTAVHEIGHTVGFQHEHQSPFSGIEWNADAVYQEFSGPPNSWPKSEIDANIINKPPANMVQGSTWDPKSIMEYEFGPGLVRNPVQYQAGIFPPGIISVDDISGVKSFYPRMPASSVVKLQMHKAAPITAQAGSQNDFVFKAPSTKKYIFQTVGELDSVMVISEKNKTENHYLAGDDDSGIEKNARISLPLVKGREYFINVRVMYAAEAQSGSIMVV